LLQELQAEPEERDPQIEADLAALIVTAEDYEAACGKARAVLAGARSACERSARDLGELAWKLRDYPPCTIVGVTVHARALVAYSEAEGHAGQHAGVVLGRGLADAVLRVAAAKA
jgi:hypothetical protein